MDDFKERLKIEKKELAEKINKLKIFIESERFELINNDQKMLLNIQLKAMNTYHECLHYRFANL